jgi:chromosome segregation ATPase
MEWLKSKTAIVGFCCVALIGFEAYEMLSLHKTMEERMGSIESDLRSMHDETDEKVSALSADMDVITKRIGVTAEDLKEAQTLTQQLRNENAALSRRLRRDISTKADSKDVLRLNEESTNRINGIQKDSDTKIDGVRGEVRGVRSDLDATREDLANSKRDLHTLIARNSTELGELRRKGERDYIEFDIRKAKGYKRVGDILVLLKKTDVKKQKFEVAINADDSPIIKKDRTANEPITFLVGRDRARYEFVVNFVDKDRIRGYISTPKDKLVASETPTLRVR